MNDRDNDRERAEALGRILAAVEAVAAQLRDLPDRVAARLGGGGIPRPTPGEARPTLGARPKGLLTTKEVMEELGVCRTTLWQLDKSGELKPIRRGRRVVRYRRRDVERFQDRPG